MKNIKWSSAPIIVLLVVGVTIAIQANPLRKRAQTRCFINITVTDGISLPVQIDQTWDCLAAKAQIVAGKIYITGANLASSLSSEEDCDLSTVKYCCVRLMETSNPVAAQLNLGDGLKRYLIYSQAQVFCKP